MKSHEPPTVVVGFRKSAICDTFRLWRALPSKAFFLGAENGLGWTWCERQKSWACFASSPFRATGCWLTRHSQQGHSPVLLRGLWDSLCLCCGICFVLTHLCWTVLVFSWMYIQHSSTCKFFSAQVKAWVWYKWAHRRGYLMVGFFVQRLTSPRCSRIEGPESAERKQRKKQIFRQGWLVLLLEKKTSWKIHFDSFCIFGIYQTNGLLAYSKKAAWAAILGEGWSSKQHKLRENCPDGNGQASGRRASDQGSAISPSVISQSQGSTVSPNGNRPCRQMASKSTSSMTLCLHKLGGWYGTSCFGMPTNMLILRRGVQDFNDSTLVLSWKRLWLKDMSLQEITKGIFCYDGWQIVAYRLFLVGCQVEERVILNCGFEDGAIVFLGMLFILIIYFVVPRACLMHGLNRTQICISCQ